MRLTALPERWIVAAVAGGEVCIGLEGADVEIESVCEDFSGDGPGEPETGRLLEGGDAGVGQHWQTTCANCHAMRHHWSMTFPEWSEPVRLMGQKVGPVTEGQLTLGTAVGLSLVSDLPRGVAAEMLEEHLRPTIWAELKREPALATEKQLAFLEKIADVKPWKHVTLSRRVASAWIDYYLTLRNVEFLRKLKLRSGDKVARTEAWADSLTGEIQTFTNDNVVSSIGASGLVYFKGGNGKCAWPSALSRVTNA